MQKREYRYNTNKNSNNYNNYNEYNRGNYNYNNKDKYNYYSNHCNKVNSEFTTYFTSTYYNTDSKKNYAKNYSKIDEPNYLEELIPDDCELIEPEFLKHYCKNDPDKNFKIVELECPINSNLMIVDISMNPKGVDEDILYLKYPEYLKSIRRGNTLIEFYDLDNYNQYVLNKTLIARKGMMKFVDLPYEIVDMKDNHYQKVSHITEESKLLARKNIFGPIFRSLNSGKSIEIYKLIKANGENAQISYLLELSAWVIASKNVCLLARNREDLKFYLPQDEDGRFTRYSFAYIIGQCWFDILSSRLNTENIEELKNYLSNKTFIGEYVGNQKHQHLIRYMKHTILFYAIVENNKGENSLTVNECYSIFHKFKLDVVPYEYIGIFSDHESLCQTLSKLYVRIAESSIIHEEEGSVLYISEIDLKRKKSRILVLAKLKTLEYRVYRKLREKLKNHFLQRIESNSLDSRKKINQFFEEVRIMLQGFSLPMPMTFYYKVAETAFEFANKFYEQCSNLHSSYIDFLEVIHSVIDKTVELKSKIIRGDNIMTYDYLLSNEVKAKKVIEIIIYAPPLYLSEEFLKTLENTYKTEIRNSFIENSNYFNVDSNIIIYHINMHNFRTFNRLDDNKFILVFGLNKEGCKRSLENLSEKMKIPQFISYNTNATLVPFLKPDNHARTSTINNFLENSISFLEHSKKYISGKIKIYDEFENNKENIINYLQDMDVIINNIKGKMKVVDIDQIKKDAFLYSDVKLNNSNQTNSISSVSQTEKESNFCQFIEIYENHINRFESLKEEFLKDFENSVSFSTSDTSNNSLNYATNVIIVDNVILDSNIKNYNTTNCKKNIVVLIPMTIPGTGKSFFVNQLKEIFNKNSNVQFDSISSDEIRRSIMEDLKRKRNFNEESAFNTSGKSASRAFEAELKRKFRALIENSNNSLLYLDKNHPPNGISKVFEAIREEFKTIENSDGINVMFVALIPECLGRIELEDNKIIPFSISYFIQCYSRIKERKNHPILNGNNKKIICILGMFINNFINFDFCNQTLMLHYQFDKALKLPFTSEIDEKQLPSDLVAAIKKFLSNIPKDNNVPIYDDRAKLVENLIQKYYPTSDKFKSTKTLVKQTAEPAIREFYGINVNFEKETKKDNCNGDNNLSADVKKVTKLTDEYFGTKKSENSKRKKSGTIRSKKLKPKYFSYLCLLISSNKSVIYNDLLLITFKSFSTINDHSSEIPLFLNSIPDGWTLPNNAEEMWHLTTLFYSDQYFNEIQNNPAYKEFEEGKTYNITVHGVVYLPQKIICCIVSSGAYVNNKFPHITLLTKDCPPKKSNDLLASLFNELKDNSYSSLLNDDSNTFSEKVLIKFDGFYVNCYIHKLKVPIQLESKMAYF